MSMVIPDAIEPVVGWRCFDIVDGLLVSPQQRMQWLPGEKARASCRRSRPTYTWTQMTPAERKQMRGQAIDQGFTPADGHYVKYLMPDGEIEKVEVHCPWGMADFTTPITHYPAEGMEWVLVLRTNGHEAPQESCHCGIYLAKNLDRALEYGHHGEGCFGQVKGWGKVIPAADGYRVSFAYPERLFFYKKPPIEFAAYEVPMFPVLECDEFAAALGIDWDG